MAPEQAGPQPQVLVVEDDAPIRELIALVLADAGFDVVPARDDTEALAALRRRVPDLMVIDMHLAGSAPVDAVLSRLRAGLQGELPVLAISGSREQARAAALGAYAFLPKPFDVDELVQLARKGLLAGRHPEAWRLPPHVRKSEVPARVSA